jgi:hypothetical protein
MQPKVGEVITSKRSRRAQEGSEVWPDDFGGMYNLSGKEK